MIYGNNINGTEIPPGVKRHFPARVKVPCTSCGGLGFHRANTADGFEETEPCDQCRQYPKSKMGRGYRWFRLDVVAQSPREKDYALITMNNGHRCLHVTSRQTAGGIWYGIYIG